MNPQSEDLAINSELQRLLQKRKLLLLEREIARKGRQARRELDREARVKSKKMAKAMARYAAREAAKPAAVTARRAEPSGAGSWISRTIVRPILERLQSERR